MSANRDEAHDGWDEFARQNLALLVTVLLRVVGNPVIAFDLAVETLADTAPALEREPGQKRGAADLGTRIQPGPTCRRGRARRRAERRAHCDQRPAHRTLSIAEQQQVISLSEQALDLPSRVADMVDALARDAPPPQQLRALRCSPLVDAEPLPHREREPDGA